MYKRILLYTAPLVFASEDLFLLFLLGLGFWFRCWQFELNDTVSE